jgi:hypothetical protein
MSLVDYAEDDLLLLRPTEYSSIQEAGGCLYAVHDVIGKVRALVRALSSARVSKLAHDGELSAEKEYGIGSDLSQLNRLSDGFVYIRFLRQGRRGPGLFTIPLGTSSWIYFA